jgi:hypothetical protein
MAALEKVIHVQHPGSRPQKQVCGEYAPLPPFAPEPPRASSTKNAGVFRGNISEVGRIKTGDALNEVALSGFKTHDRRAPRSDAGAARFVAFKVSSSPLQCETAAHSRNYPGLRYASALRPVSQERRIMMQGE